MINSKQWQWMKRYRVWEANRKVFLYPENWLEPELRDNKSSFFKDLESELLQSDITEESAYRAYVNYLQKLDDVAKLDICAMYLDEGKVLEDDDPDEYHTQDDVLHVFARTPGANRKYFYRTFENNTWTPWDKVDLDIEDNPILPVVWNGRLFLFWLNILQKGPDNTGPRGATGTMAELTVSEVNSSVNTNIKVEVNLSWSEYVNGKWQPRRTSDFNDPISWSQPPPFQRSSISLASEFIISDGNKNSFLKLFVIRQGEKPIMGRDPRTGEIVNLEIRHRGFYLPNKYNTVKFRIVKENDFRKIRPGNGDSSQTLTISYSENYRDENICKVLPKSDTTDIRYQPENRFEVPLFLKNNEHVLHVLPEILGRPTIEEASEKEPSFIDIILIPEDPLVQVTPEIPDLIGPRINPGLDNFINPIRILNKESFSSVTIDFNGNPIGETGAFTSKIELGI